MNATTYAPRPAKNLYHPAAPLTTFHTYKALREFEARLAARTAKAAK